MVICGAGAGGAGSCPEKPAAVGPRYTRSPCRLHNMRYRALAYFGWKEARAFWNAL